MSNVPPPRSYTTNKPFCWLSSPYASAAAVGSFSKRNTEPGQSRGIFRRLTLGIVEVRRHRDDRTTDRAELVFRVRRNARKISAQTSTGVTSRPPATPKRTHERPLSAAKRYGPSRASRDHPRRDP